MRRDLARPPGALDGSKAAFVALGELAWARAPAIFGHLSRYPGPAGVAGLAARLEDGLSTNCRRAVMRHADRTKCRRRRGNDLSAIARIVMGCYPDSCSLR